MKWDNPFFLYSLLAVPLLMVLLLLFERSRRIYLENKIKPAGLLLMSFGMMRFKRILFISGMVFLLLAAASPRWGKNMQKIKKISKDIIFLVDTSKSMLAEDINPSRMELSKRKMIFMVENMIGTRCGIIFFAGKAFMQCPVTFDLDALGFLANEAWNNMVPLPGTNIESAVRLALKSFPSSGKVSERYIILLTDGEELQGQAESVLDILKESGTRVIALGIGTGAGAPIPIKNKDGVKNYKKDREGNTVMTRLGSDILRKLADSSGGMYLDSTGNASDVNLILEFLKKESTTEGDERMIAQLEHRFQYPLAMALFLFVFEFILSERRKKR
ncbi:MAG: VWA domain-containing protein [Elusimicrobiota bacterium]